MTKRLYRSRKLRQVAGVCGGIAEYFNVDVTVVRLGVVIATIATGIVPGTLVYLVAMVIVPEAPPS